MVDGALDVAVILNFTDKYCTADMAAADPETTKDKVIISNDAYATGEQLDKVNKSLIDVSFRLRKMK